MGFIARTYFIDPNDIPYSEQHTGVLKSYFNSRWGEGSWSLGSVCIEGDKRKRYAIIPPADYSEYSDEDADYLVGFHIRVVMMWLHQMPATVEFDEKLLEDFISYEALATHPNRNDYQQVKVLELKEILTKAGVADMAQIVERIKEGE